MNSVLTSLELAQDETTLSQIKDELVEAGYIKRHDLRDKKERAKKQAKSDPFHYISSDGYDIFNNNKREWNKIIDRGMAADFSWNVSARKYQEMYDWMLGY